VRSGVYVKPKGDLEEVGESHKATPPTALQSPQPSLPALLSPQRDNSIAIEFIVAPIFQALDAHFGGQTNPATYFVWGHLLADLTIAKCMRPNLGR
jgi:hypothetical protein